jgi:zinc D-Ala-D-Ala dipeptidase
MFKLLLYFLFSGTFSFAAIPTGFVNLAEVNPSIEIEIRYSSNWNFVGRPITGYKANKCYLTKEAAQALSEAQEKLIPQGYSLLVLDCYRPKRAVADFMNWSEKIKDLKMEKIFYPEMEKSKLIEKGFIGDKSGHSRGSAVDITLIKKEPVAQSEAAVPVAVAEGKLRFQEDEVDCRQQKNITATTQLDMGTTFDCFSKLAVTKSRAILKEAQENRKILKQAVEQVGFVNDPKKWWHFTLKNEPNKNKKFDFIIE